jgi:FtsP/CotA-like multicopper oxidase with cupredoxin domain
MAHFRSFFVSVLVVLAGLQCARGQDTKTFTLELSRGSRAPDGVEREVILVNGEFPAPLLEIHQGDDVVVEVFNGLNEHTSIHFHGENLVTPSNFPEPSRLPPRRQ